MADADAPETGSDTTTTHSTDTVTPDAPTDWQAEADKWKAQSRKHEDRAKDNAKRVRELEEVQKASMTESDRAIADAMEQGRVEVKSATAAARVDDTFRLAAAGRTIDVDAVLEGLDRSKFITSEYEPDREAITAWVDRIAPAATEETKPQGPLGSGLDLGQGSTQTTPIGDDAGIENMLRDAVGLPKR